MPMKIALQIDCYLSSGCGSKEALRENISRALALEGVFPFPAEVKFHLLDNEKALAMGLTGSPSVIINGEQLQKTAGAAGST